MSRVVITFGERGGPASYPYFSALRESKRSRASAGDDVKNMVGFAACWGVTPLPTELRPGTLEEAWRVIGQLLRIIDEQRGQITALQARRAAPERRLRQNSQESSRPPSSDAPSQARPALRPPSGRRSGGQPGHEGHPRRLVPTEPVNRIVLVKPRRCGRCAAALHGEDTPPRRHQVTAVPPVPPDATDYQLHGPVCDAFGVPTAAPWPTAMPRGSFGSSSAAPVAVCTAMYHLTYQ